MRCSFQGAGARLQKLLVEWMRQQGETCAAEWFEQHWCVPTKGRWLLAHGGIGITGNNQGVESTWRWDRFSFSHGLQVCAAGGPCCVHCRDVQDYEGCPMPASKWRMIWSFAGHANLFPSQPASVVNCKEWDLLQPLHPVTLFCTQVLKGNSGVWSSSVADITDEVETTAELL